VENIFKDEISTCVTMQQVTASGSYFAYRQTCGNLLL